MADPAGPPVSVGRFFRRRALVLVCALAVVMALGWTGWSLVQAARAAKATRASAVALQSQVKAKNWDGARGSSRALSSSVARLQAATESASLRLLSHAPVVGRDVRAVRETAAALSSVSGSVPPLLAAVQEADSARLFREGRVDLAALQALAAPSTAASDALERASVQLNALNSSSLHFGLDKQIPTLRAQVDDLARQARLASLTAQRLPGLLGADGPRRYLLVDQNLAEARPTGGIFGAYALLVADDGRLSLQAAGVNNELGDLQPGSLNASEQARRLYGADLALNQNFNLSPDFPQAARLAAQLWQQQHPGVQGVLAVDPVLVQSLLRVTGPVAVPGGPKLTSHNAADVLMRQVYSTLGGNTEARTSYLMRSTGAVFHALFAGHPDAEALSGVLRTARKQGHLQAWSPQPADQAFFREAGVSGELGDPGSGTVGVYLTNVDGSKLDYYVHAEATGRPACSDQRAGLSIHLRSSAPRRLPTYVSNQLVPAGSKKSSDHVALVSLYLPPGRALASLTIDGKPQAFASDPESGWTLVRVAVTIPAGGDVALDAQLDGVSTAPQLRTQPMVRPWRFHDAGCAA